MEFFLKMLSLQGQLFLMMAVGFLIRKLRLTDAAGRKTLTNILLNVILPCNIVASFLGVSGFTGEFFRNCMVMLLVGLGTQIFAAAASRLLFPRFPVERRNIMTYTMICSNSSFIGMPLADALFGSLGVTLTSIFQIPLRFQMWTSGLALFARRKAGWRENLRNVLLHPCIIAVFLGLALMLARVQLPGVLSSTVTAMSRCTTPVSMLVIGSLLADTDMKSAFSLPILYCSACRLLLFPAATLLILKPLGVDPVILGVAVILNAAPAGNTTAILADKYSCDPSFASQVVFTTTLLSLATLPLVSLMLG